MSASLDGLRLLLLVQLLRILLKQINNPILMEEQRLGDRLEALDKELVGWAKLTRGKLLRRLLSLGVQDKIKLAKSISRIKIAQGKTILSEM